MTLAGHTTLIPSLQIGSPITLESTSTFEGATMSCGTFNKICTILTVSADEGHATVQLTLPDTVTEFRASADGASFVFLNFDLTEVATSLGNIAITDGDTALTTAVTNTANSGLVQLGAIAAIGASGITESATIAITSQKLIPQQQQLTMYCMLISSPLVIETTMQFIVSS